MKKQINLVYILIVLFCVVLTYSNHFDNPFEFDDSHSIQSNEAISKLDVYRFFTDASCLTALPSNQSYRPITVLLNSIDYQISKRFNKDPKFKSKPGLNPFYYHLTHMFWYLVLLVLLFYVYKRLFDHATKGLDEVGAGPHRWSNIIAFFTHKIIQNFIGTSAVGFTIISFITIDTFIAFDCNRFFDFCFYTSTYSNVIGIACLEIHIINYKIRLLNII